MSFMDNMMGMMMGNMSKEKRVETMKKMMPKMMEDMNPEDMMTMMPTMMESMGGGKTMMRSMHKMMPEMMHHCFSSMKKAEGKEMLTFCRGMLDKMEKKYL